MMKISFSPTFVRQYKKCEKLLQEDILEKIELLKDEANHKSLKVHSLHGQLAGRYSFSVNYKIRIVFKYLKDDEVGLIALGDHNIYK